MKPTIAITIGDFNGIGPEIALRSATHPSVKRICTPLLVGPLNVFDHVNKQLRIKTKLENAVLTLLPKTAIAVADVGDGIWADVHYGQISRSAGRSAGAAIEHAVALCQKGVAAGMVTGPVSKEALNLAGYNFPGQTEMIALLSRSLRFTMMLVSDQMKIGLVTTHLPLASISSNLTMDRVYEKITVVHESLKRDYRIKKPRIAVLALNPHAGENGMLGNEEQVIILPCIDRLRAEEIIAEGPFAADAFFGTHHYKNYDAVMAMYHDQGLIPMKMSGFETGVNFSAGLQIIRTSPDHGTAFNIAGSGTASVTSMIEAIKLAVLFSKNRTMTA